MKSEDLKWLVFLVHTHGSIHSKPLCYLHHPTDTHLFYHPIHPKWCILVSTYRYTQVCLCLCLEEHSMLFCNSSIVLNTTQKENKPIIYIYDNVGAGWISKETSNTSAKVIMSNSGDHV